MIGHKSKANRTILNRFNWPSDGTLIDTSPAVPTELWSDSYGGVLRTVQISRIGALISDAILCHAQRTLFSEGLYKQCILNPADRAWGNFYERSTMLCVCHYHSMLIMVCVHHSVRVYGWIMKGARILSDCICVSTHMYMFEYMCLCVT